MQARLRYVRSNEVWLRSKARKARARELQMKITKKTLKQKSNFDIDRANQIAALTKELMELVV